MADEGGVGLCGVVAGGCDCGGEGTKLLILTDRSEKRWIKCNLDRCLINLTE